MAFEGAKAAASRILEGIENGTMNTTESVMLVEDADPALVYLLFTWLRRKYADNPNADAITSRLLAVVDKSPAISKKMKEGQSDPVVAWFEEEHSYREFGSRDFVDLIVEKLEG